jgi:exodeoxyribonuclease VII large subunit
VRVQGAGAASEIANAVSFLDGMGECDVIIVGRGGGSLEDLWAFNEEVVARAIFRAKTPIISAVGHETDTTMSDFVADVRAATPTHAAVMVVPKREDILAHLATMTSSLKLRHDAVLRRARLQLLQEKRRLLDPRVVLFRHWQVLDETQKRLETRLTKLMRDNAAKLDELKRALYLQSPLRQMRFKREAFLVEKERLRALSPERTLALMHARTLEHKQALVHFMRAFAKQRRNEHGALVTKLDALSPLRVLSRGYSVVDDDEGRVLSKASHFAECQRIRIRVEDGVVKAQVQEIVRGT